MSTKLSDFRPEIQAAAITSATQIALLISKESNISGRTETLSAEIVRRAIEILKEYNKHTDIGD
ncbi:MAG: hypothetical protein ABSB42_03520 [Tepidisphaeraceae bacterium]